MSEKENKVEKWEVHGRRQVKDKDGLSWQPFKIYLPIETKLTELMTATREHLANQKLEARTIEIKKATNVWQE